MKKLLIISTSIDLVRIVPDRIVYIASDGNYSTLVQTDNEVRLLSYQLGQIEKMLSHCTLTGISCISVRIPSG